MNALQRFAVDAITRQYLESADFNGLPVARLREALNLSAKEFSSFITPLVSSGAVVLVASANPHILGVPALSRDEQLHRLAADPTWGVCAYPSRRRLLQVVNRRKFAGRPFTLRLALGEPALKHVAFEYAVLERYLNDPRYSFFRDDISGQIGFMAAGRRGSKRRDDIFLKSFGFCFDRRLNRGIAVFLCYLSRLSPEHQRVWEASELPGHWTLHPDYYRTALMGDEPEGISIFDALGEVLAQVNDICEKIGWPLLFKRDFRRGERPREFGVLLRPTAREFISFTHALDKLLADNIDVDFFGPEVPRHRLLPNHHKVQLGSITMLEYWLSHRFQLDDKEVIASIIKLFRKVRELRSPTAHEFANDAYNHRYLRRQRELMDEAFKAMTLLRTVLRVNRVGATYEFPEWWKDVKIWDF